MVGSRLGWVAWVLFGVACAEGSGELLYPEDQVWMPVAGEAADPPATGDEPQDFAAPAQPSAQPADPTPAAETPMQEPMQEPAVPEPSASDPVADEQPADPTPADPVPVDPPVEEPKTPMVTPATDGPPDDHCEGASFEGRAYYFCTNNEDWDAARPLCQAIGGDLVSINTAEEQAFIDMHINGDSYLIGLNKKNASGMNAPDVWEWVDGTPVDMGYLNWNSGEPDNLDCGRINNGSWRDIGCGNSENWICEVQ